MENLVTVDPDFWRGKRVFLTGQTGFKGSWLSLWLQEMGAVIRGLALAPDTDPNLFTSASVANGMESQFGDIRDLETVRASLVAFNPEIVIHMAAQPLVRLSYQDPVGTYATNVMGTVHVLEAARQVEGLKAIVVVTTDKCYENREWVWGYREDEPMGGHDPYSNSKGCAELACSAYRKSFFDARGAAAVASGRAGNVIGGGDWAPDRLVPDILKAFAAGEKVSIRNPLATRPWQHVLEPLSGYLVLAQRLWEEPRAFAEGWNFGPREDDAWPVQTMVEALADRWGNGASWVRDEQWHPHEARALTRDISTARARLGWAPRWTLAETLDRIVDWQRAWLGGADMRTHCLSEIRAYASGEAPHAERRTG
jgi:CDP-glucose 4,6-dehydratase